MAAAAILNFGKMSITLDWIKISCIKLIIWEDAPRRRGDDHVTKSRNRKLIRVTSWNVSLKHMCVDLSDCSRYLNQIWQRTQIPHYQHAGMANSHKLKIQDGGGCHLEFRKNVNNSGLDTYICTKLYGNMQHGHAEMNTWPKVETKS